MESATKRRKLDEEATIVNPEKNREEIIHDYINQIEEYQENNIINPNHVLHNLLKTWLEKYSIPSRPNVTDIQFFQLENKAVNQHLVLHQYLQDFNIKLQVNTTNEISHLFALLMELDKFFIENNINLLAQAKHVDDEKKLSDEAEEHFFCLLIAFFTLYPVYLINSKNLESTVLDEQLITCFRSEFFIELIRYVSLFVQQQRANTIEKYLKSIEKNEEYIIPLSKELGCLNLKNSELEKFVDTLFSLLASDSEYIRDSARKILSEINLGGDRQFELFKQKLTDFEKSADISQRYFVLLFLNSLSMSCLNQQQKTEILQKVYSILQALIEFKEDDELLVEDENQLGVELEDLQFAACDVLLDNGLPMSNTDEIFAYLLHVFSDSLYSGSLRIAILDLLLKLDFGNHWEKLFTAVFNTLNLSEKDNKDFKIQVYFALLKAVIPEKYRKIIFGNTLDCIKKDFNQIVFFADTLFNCDNIFIKDLELLVDTVSRQDGFLNSRAGKKYFSFLLKLAEKPEVAESLIEKLFGFLDKNDIQSMRADNAMLLYAINKHKQFASITHFFEKNINDKNSQVLFFACLNQLEQANSNKLIQSKLLKAIAMAASSFSAENVSFLFSLKVDNNVMTYFSEQCSAYIIKNKDKINDVLLLKYLLVLVHWSFLEKLDQLVEVFCKILVEKQGAAELSALTTLFFDLLTLIKLKDEHVQKILETLKDIAMQKRHSMSNTVLGYIIKLCSDYQRIQWLGKLLNELDDIMIIASDVCSKIKILTPIQKINMRTYLDKNFMINNFMMMILDVAICSDFSNYKPKLNENYVLTSSDDKSSHSLRP